MIRLAVSSLTFEGFKNSQFESLFENAAKMGYKYVEFNCWYPNMLVPENIRRLRRCCENSGLIPAALHVSGFGGNTNEILTLNTMHKLYAIGAAVELGCRRVVGSAMDSCLHLDELVKETELLAKEAENADVLVCLENHCKNILAVSGDYEYIFRRMDSTHIGICLDGGHLEAAGEKIESFIEKLDYKINHIHLKENRFFGKKSFCRFGQGTTDNEAMVNEMYKRGYSGYMSVELSPEIGENGDFKPFTYEDRKRPLEMFKKLERG